MKTDKELILKIVNKFKDNVIHDKPIGEGIQYYDGTSKKWLDLNVAVFNYRIKPETIIINGVEIPKPLDVSTLNDDEYYYFVFADRLLYDCEEGINIKCRDIRFVYETKEEAIEASKAIFGI